MRTADLIATAAAWTADSHPTRNFHGGPVLYISSGTIRRGWIWFSHPAPAGVTVQSATLTLTFGNGWEGKAFTLELRPVTASWKSSKITDGNAPTTGSDVGHSASGLGFDSKLALDVTAMVQAVADGGDWYGVEIGVSAGAPTFDQAIFGPGARDDRRPELVVVYGYAPAAPSNLRPSDSHTVGTVRPALAWDFTSPDASAHQGKSQVQVDNDLAFGSPAWDSGMVANTVAQAIPTVDLPTATLLYWRVKVQDSGGMESAWSDPVAFQIAAKPTVSISNPPSDGTISPDSTPTIVHSVSGGTQARVQRLLLDPSGRTIWDTGETVGTDTSIEVPLGKVTQAGVTYTAVVRIWDAIEREATPGVPTYAEARRTFSYSPSADVLPVALLTATERGDPGVDLVWRYLGTAEGFALVRDGEIVADGIVPASVGSGTDYSMTDWRAPLGVPHTWEVRAVVFDGVNEKHSQGNPTATATPAPRLMWIVRPSTNETIPLYGTAEPETGPGEDADVRRPIGRADSVVVFSFVGGLEGTFEGTILGDESFSAAEYEALLRSWVDLAGSDEIRLAWGGRNIPVVMLPGKTITERIDEGYDVSIPFAQAQEA